MGENNHSLQFEVDLTYFLSYILLHHDLFKVNDDLKDKIIEIENRINSKINIDFKNIDKVISNGLKKEWCIDKFG